MLSSAAATAQQGVGTIRGVVIDNDFKSPLPGVKVETVGLEQKVETTEQGTYTIRQVPAGKHTLVFSKDGFVRKVKTDVLVTAGRLTEVDITMAGDFTDMEEFVVQDLLRLDRGSEGALLQFRFKSPSFMDSVGKDLMSQAGASDAAQGLRLVAGATVKNGKSAVIRGLPDRYVSSQMNGVRLPTADEDKRAVELDQFPA
ncbi:MAG: carboxypeptidase regulatory-like domain-containing protein, partial [Planctomycetota bacterium]